MEKKKSKTGTIRRTFTLDAADYMTLRVYTMTRGDSVQALVNRDLKRHADRIRKNAAHVRA